MYFPQRFGVPAERNGNDAGLDFYANPVLKALIDQAIESGEAVVGETGTLRLEDERADAMLIVAPVFRGALPPTLEARRAAATGVLAVVLSVSEWYSSAAMQAPDSGLRLRLLEAKAASQPRVRGDWLPESGAAPAIRADGRELVYFEAFDMAGQRWTVELRPSSRWEAEHPLKGLPVVPLGLGALALLLVWLRLLMRRSDLADTLERTHADDIVQRREVEAWANKLFLAVEQNPATVYITDLDGRFEYVNDKFVETTGYSREEALGQRTSLLRPLEIDLRVYEALWAEIRRGNIWRGELQARRRDGTLFWERMVISPIKSATGEITNFIAIKEDITELRRITMRLQDSESRFRAAMSAMIEALVIISPQGRIVFANRAAEDLFGGGDPLLGCRSEEIGVDCLHEDGSPCRPDEYPIVVTLRDQCEIRGALFGFGAAEGAVRWTLVNTSLLPNDSAEGGYSVVMTASDVTERRQAEEQLKMAFEAIRCSSEGIIVTDADQRILSVNPAFEAVTGYRADEVTGKTPEMVASVRHDARFYSEIQAALRDQGQWQGEVWNQRKNGEVFPEWLGVSMVRDPDGQPKYYVYIFSDMTERKEAQQRIEMLAHHDPLTGLPNRLLLRDRFEQAKAQANRMQSRVALMYLDLDRFKTINDSLGHPVGDDLLKEVVERLKQCVRESDTISRQGGDEFIILLNDVRDSDAVSRVADKIQQRMAEPLVLEKHLLNTSFSIGTSLYPDDGQEFDILLQKADTAMYHAKEAGRNGHRFFTEQMNLKVVEHLKLETQLRRALDNNEFVLHYQPQIDLHDGRIVGAEALIRWNSPDEGMVSPAKFIPVAEETGLIVQIGAWVLNEACRQATAWQRSGLPPFVVAVNLSALQFRRMELVNTVINALVLSDLDSQWLELELTESILVQDTEVTLDSVRRLKALGVKLSVDDFGTGYSSLAYLKRFAVDKLKIDQSFVRDLVADPDDAAIVRAIIQMAHSLKLKTIAEGVESEESANLLRVFRCDEIQGYWLARPMPADALETFVRSRLASSR